MCFQEAALKYFVESIMLVIINSHMSHSSDENSAHHISYKGQLEGSVVTEVALRFSKKTRIHTAKKLCHYNRYQENNLLKCTREVSSALGSLKRTLPSDETLNQLYQETGTVRGDYGFPIDDSKFLTAHIATERNQDPTLMIILWRCTN